MACSSLYSVFENSSPGPYLNPYAQEHKIQQQVKTIIVG